MSKSTNINKKTDIPVNRCYARKPTDIISWNINDLGDKICGNKTQSSELVDLIKSCHIFCFQETKKELQFPEYKCINQNRKGSRSGGVCIGIHRSLEKHIKQLETGDPDIAAISLSRAYTGMDKDLLVINVYDSRENSSYKKRTNEAEEDQHPQTLENLLCFMGHRPILCSIDMESEPLLLAESIERRFEDVPRRSKWNPSTSPTVFKLEATHNPVIAHEIRVAQDLECNNTDDVLKLNDIISNTYSEICKNIDTSPNAKDATTTKKRRRNKSRPKNVWFDRDCIDAKRELNQLARRYGKDPTNPELRTNFFKDLYKEWPMTKEAKDIVDNGAQPDNLDATLQELNEEMNRSISVEEIETSLKKLKNGKASEGYGTQMVPGGQQNNQCTGSNIKTSNPNGPAPSSSKRTSLQKPMSRHLRRIMEN
ncbi:hypothetical protein ACHWQZ_G000983 [Mnemiopsis leidyi]